MGRLLAAGLVAGALLYALGAFDPQRLGRETYGCDGVDVVPARDSVEEVKAATLCLLNGARTEEGLAPLREEASLEEAAQAHAADMAVRGFFAHESPDGTRPHQRIRRAGYPRRAATGENLAFGEGRGGTPFEIYNGWMHSAGHRRNVLRRRFTEIGLGVGLGVTRAFYVTTFGAR